MQKFGQKYSLLAFILGSTLLLLLAFTNSTGLVVASRNFSDNLAQVVGMSAGVEPNEYNTLAMQLENKQSELNDRERALDQREEQLAQLLKDEIAARNRNLMFLMAFVATLLLLLIGMNFYLDRRREEQAMHTPELQTRL